MTWRVHVEGRDPELDKIVWRRFGRDHGRPCFDPNKLTCAGWECQVANRCRLFPPAPKPDEPTRAAQ